MRNAGLPEIKAGGCDKPCMQEQEQRDAASSPVVLLPNHAAILPRTPTDDATTSFESRRVSRPEPQGISHAFPNWK